MVERFRRFMAGRYGTDELSQFLLGVAVACIFLSIFLKGRAWNAVILVILIICYFRMFSRNYQKRYQENQKFLGIRNRVLYWWGQRKYRREQRKIYHIYKCPGCRQKIRIPRGKGKIVIKCPKCHMEFTKKS